MNMKSTIPYFMDNAQQCSFYILGIKVTGLVCELLPDPSPCPPALYIREEEVGKRESKVNPENWIQI